MQSGTAQDCLARARSKVNRDAFGAGDPIG
jgi:hypothetical protein